MSAQRGSELRDRREVALSPTADPPQQARDFSGPWFDAETAAAYIPCKSRKAFTDWCRHHGIVRRSNGSVTKADLDRVLRRRTRRGQHPNSRANLLRSHAQQCR